MYVSGRIKAVQLEYSEAHKNLLQAVRKAPQHTAVGFKQTVSTYIYTGFPECEIEKCLLLLGLIMFGLIISYNLQYMCM